MRRSVWMRVLAVVLIISMLAAPVSAAGRNPKPGHGTNCIVGGIISIIRDIIRDIWDDWFDVPGDEDPEPTPPEEPTVPSEPEETEPTEPGETEPEDPTEPEETLKTVLNLIEGHANTANGHLLRGVTYSLSQLAEEQSKTESASRSLRNIKTMAISAAKAAVAPTSEGDTVEYGFRNWVNGGQYYIQNVRANHNSAPSWLCVNNGEIEGTREMAAATLFTLTILDNGKYYLSYDNNGTEMYFYLNTANQNSNADAFSTEPQELVIEHYTISSTQYLVDDGNLMRIGSNSKYLCQHGGTTVTTYGAESSNGDSGNAMWFHQVQDGATTKVTYGVIESEPVVDPSDGSRDIPVSVLTATAGNSQSGQGPENTLDNNDSTLWHTDWNGSARDTHWIQFQLSEDYKVDGLRYCPRQGSDDGSQNGLITEFEIQISDEGQTFTPVCTGTWSYSDRSWKIATFDAVSARYVRLVVKNAQSNSGNLYASAAEIRLTGTMAAAPSEPEQPAIGSEVVFFPVTMFNYDHNTINAATDALDNDTTVREGLYFTGANIDTGSPTYETVTDMSAFVAGRYCIQNIRASENNVDSWLGVHSDNKISASSENGRLIWTLVIEDGTYYLTCEFNGQTQYLNVGTNGDTDGVTTTKTPVEIVSYSADSQGVQLKQNSYYLCQWGSTTAVEYGGYNVNNDPGNAMRFYAVDDEGNVSATPTTITSTDRITAGYMPYNKWAYYSNSDNAQNMFYSGLVEEYLDENDEIVFTVNEPGIFTFDASDPSTTNDGLKDIYQNVGLPFVKEDGYYTFDSDANGTYFADTTSDGVSDPWYGAEDDYFNMYLDYGITQGWDDMDYGDGSTNLWAPYNTNANDTSAGAIDYHFGMRADIPFSMTTNGRIKSNDDNSEPITFTFAGDDDVWIFIDGQLVIDLGGIHNRLGATIDFANNTITYALPEANTSTAEFGSFTNPEQFPLNDDGTITVKLYDDAAGPGALGQTRADFSTKVDHQMSIFYLERGEGASNCQIKFNLPMLDTVMVTKEITHSWSAAADERDGDAGDGTEKLTAREQAAVDKLDFKFKLWKQEPRSMPTAVANTNYYLLDKDDNILGIYTTGADGVFSLKNGQTAMFMTDLGNGTVTYAVEELELDLDTFLTPDYKYAGLATNGFGFYGETLNNDTEDENDTKTVQEHLYDASLIGEQELPMNAVQLVSYNVTPYGSIEAIESLEFICTNYLNADLPSPTARAYEDIIVIDYGLPVQIDPLHNDVFRGNDIEIVAWGDETLELNEVLEDNQIYAVPDGTEDGTSWSGEKFKTVAYVSNGTSYNTEAVELADCLYTFNKTEDGFYEVSATAADGTTVYLNHYSSGNSNPNVTTPGKIDVQTSSHTNMFKLVAQIVSGGTGSARGLHFHAEAAMPYWNRCGNDTSTKCHEYLYRPVREGEESSAEINGYVLVTDIAEVVDGGQYLIVHDSEVDDNLYILHPSTSTGKWDHVAKLGNTNTGAVPFDSGNVTFNNVTYAETANADGTITFTRDTFDYELTEQMTEVEEIRYVIKVNSTVEEKIGDETVTKTACRYALGKVYIVPATIMYYEENFSDMITFTGSGWNSDATVADQDNVSAYQEPGVAGTATGSTYGSDVAYLSDDGDSNGTYRFGDTTNKAIRFTYTFTGTGSSIFARTSANTGYMQVKLYRGTEITDEALEDITYRDTYWKDENGTELDAAGTLYNIPVYSTDENLDYDTYTVVCTIAKEGTITAGNDSGAGNEFYLDGIRVLRPLNIVVDQYDEWDEEGNLIQPIVYDELTTKALDAYDHDGESNLDVVTLRQKLITDYDYLLPELDENGEVVGEEEQNWPFAVLTDVEGEVVLASDYISIGPKNEVYLSKESGATNGQSVTFSLKYWQPEGLKLYMGMKAPFGHASVNVGHENIQLNNAPDCYYDVTKNHASLEERTDEDGNTYYIVTYTFEAAESIVSLTNIKVVGNYEFFIMEGSDEEFEGGIGEGND